MIMCGRRELYDIKTGNYRKIKLFITALLKLRYTIFNILYCASKFPRMWVLIRKIKEKHTLHSAVFVSQEHDFLYSAAIVLLRSTVKSVSFPTRK